MPSDQPTPRRVRTITERHGVRNGHGTAFYLLVFVTAAIVLNAVFGDKGMLAMMRAQRECAQLSAQVERKRQDNQQLREKVKRLKEDPATIEDLARRNLGLMKRGEKVFTIIDVAPTTPPSAPSESPAPPSTSPSAPSPSRTPPSTPPRSRPPVE